MAQISTNMGKLRKDWPNWHKKIDQAVTMKANWIHLHMPEPATFAMVKAGTFPDHWADGATYARSKGLKVGITNVNKWYPNYLTNIDQFLIDLEWAFNKWKPDGYEAEEFPLAPNKEGNIVMPTTYLNSVWDRIRALINKKITAGVLPSNFQFGASFASHVFSDFYKSGIDINYINSSHVLDYVRPEMVYQDNPLALSNTPFETKYNEWLAQFPGIDMVRPVIYYTWSGLESNCPGLNTPDCYNKSVFDQQKWAHEKGLSFSLYIINDISASMWPNTPKYPGTNFTEKTRSAMSGIVQPNITALDIRSTPAGASIKINGGNYGVTPRVKELAAGTYTLERSLAGYQTETMQVTAIAGQTIISDITLKSTTPTTGYIDVRTNPPGATVSLDGVAQTGTTPMVLAVTSSVIHTIVINKPTFKPVTRTAIVGEGLTVVLDIPLELIGLPPKTIIGIYTLIPGYGQYSLESDGVKQTGAKFLQPENPELEMRQYVLSKIPTFIGRDLISSDILYINGVLTPIAQPEEGDTRTIICPVNGKPIKQIYKNGQWETVPSDVAICAEPDYIMMAVKAILVSVIVSGLLG